MAPFLREASCSRRGEAWEEAWEAAEAQEEGTSAIRVRAGAAHPVLCSWRPRVLTEHPKCGGYAPSRSVRAQYQISEAYEEGRM